MYTFHRKYGTTVSTRERYEYNCPSMWLISVYTKDTCQILASAYENCPRSVFMGNQIARYIQILEWELIIVLHSVYNYIKW